MQFESKMSSCPLRKMSSCPLCKMSSCPLCKMSSCPLVQDVQLSTVQGFCKTGNQIDVDTQTLIMCILPPLPPLFLFCPLVTYPGSCDVRLL